ncbi:MAG TPA: substrate-binding domain-containing protein [bacterium]
MTKWNLTRRAFASGLLAAATILALALPAAAQRTITVASTTSTQNSGLFEYLLPKFQAKTGIAVKVVAVGTGQAIKMAEKGDADVLFVHDAPSELKFMAEGWGLDRREVMYNDFIVVGPKSDPAGVKGMKDTAAAFKKIAEKHAPFLSRGDDSGTHKAELRFWKDDGIDVKKATGGWYREAGQGMGATLNMASASDGYCLTDRGTWLSFKNRKDLIISVEGDPKLFNQYGIMLVNPAKWPHVKKDDGMAFINWVTSAEGQKAIAGYLIDGQQLFFPNYKKS